MPTSSTKIAASITAYSADVLDFVVPQFQGEAKHVFLAGVFSLRRESRRKLRVLILKETQLATCTLPIACRVRTLRNQIPATATVLGSQKGCESKHATRSNSGSCRLSFWRVGRHPSNEQKIAMHEPSNETADRPQLQCEVSPFAKRRRQADKPRHMLMNCRSRNIPKADIRSMGNPVQLRRRSFAGISESLRLRNSGRCLFSGEFVHCARMVVQLRLQNSRGKVGMVGRIGEMLGFYAER